MKAEAGFCEKDDTPTARKAEKTAAENFMVIQEMVLTEDGKDS